MSVTIRALTREDVREAAALHRTAFPSFFLSSLGEPFLREFYRAFLEPQGIALVARSEAGHLVGVAVGHTQPAGFFRRLLIRRWYAFALASLRLVLRRPSVVPRLLRAVTYRGQTPLEVRGALLSSICVADEARGTGAAKRLLEAWTASVVETGVSEAYLTTDSEDNDRVNAFYRGANWALDGTFETPEGRKMNCYTWQDGSV
ncbi:GNAT family N-acetyltransferase [Nocardioides lijunqiniae]|uniref:GNAT family N-acetyltransferase n=1 Tax=Nocardioides lijunqiniae TaxID=2760832 RepID=UPI00187897F7|nr:GNAT family N-acetyltransferase [Nocardioides lijunqiniae]